MFNWGITNYIYIITKKMRLKSVYPRKFCGKS